MFGQRRRRRRAWWRRDPRLVISGLAVSMVLLALLATQVYGSLHVEPRTVRVHPGDTLWSIAAENYDSNLRDRVNDIAAVNDIQGGRVHPGQVLTVP